MKISPQNHRKPHTVDRFRRVFPRRRRLVVLTRCLQKKKTKQKKVIYIQVLITAEEFLKRERTSDGFYHLQDQSQTRWLQLRRTPAAPQLSRGATS